MTVKIVRELAKQRGISLSFICKKIGVAAPYFIDLEKSGREIPDEKLSQIANVLFTTNEYLKGETDNPEIPKKDTPLPAPMLGKDAQKLLDMYDEMGKESKEQLILYATSLYYVDRANRSAQYSGALAAYEGGTQQHTVSKETAEEVLRLIDGMEKNT